MKVFRRQSVLLGDSLKMRDEGQSPQWLWVSGFDDLLDGGGKATH